MGTDYLQNVRERTSYENHFHPSGDGRGFACACACEDRLGGLGIDSVRDALKRRSTMGLDLNRQ
jgi:hypothetical protein